MAIGSSSKPKRRSRPSQTSPLVSKAGIPHDWTKDEEELDWEEKLFGAAKRPRTELSQGNGGGDDGDLEGVEDDALFTIDAPLADLSDNSDDDSDEEEGPSFAQSSPSDDDDEEDVNREENSDEEPTIHLPPDLISASPPLKPKLNKGKEKQPIWTDPADELISIDMLSDRRLRKLARGKGNAGEGVVGGAELERRLREQFETLHPPPSWAKLRIPPGTPSLSSLLSTTKSFIDTAIPIPSSTSARPALQSGTLDIQRLRNANQANPTTGKKESAGAGGGVVDFAWHPSNRVGVLAVAGGDRRVRFFNIDGHTNPTLMTLHLPSLPLTRSTFHPSGTSILLTGTRPFYYTYDLSSQKCLRSPRNLFGSITTPTSPNSLTKHAFSPDGTLLAVAGRRGAVSVMDWSNAGVGAVVAELRSGRGGTVCDLVWSKDGRELSVLGGREGSEVEVWDVGNRRVVRKWRDDRAFGGGVMRLSKDGEFAAIGSSTGIVNLYSSSNLVSRQQATATFLPELRPEPYKSLEHLTTAISSLAFHPSGEMMVAASSAKRNALKMYHLPTATAFQNWPTPTTPLGRVTSTGFSSGGEYLAVGNQKGQVLLWSVKHFANL